jgi:hypothetical protein
VSGVRTAGQTMVSTAQISAANRFNPRVAAKMCPKGQEMISRLGLFGTVVLLGLMVTSPDVTVDYDRSYDFSQPHTFPIKVGTPWENPLSEQRTRDAVSRILIQHGWNQADGSKADALVMVQRAMRARKSLWGLVDSGTAGGTEYRKGALVQEIFAARANKLVFRGVAQREISAETENNEKQIEKTTETMFKSFPPS